MLFTSASKSVANVLRNAGKRHPAFVLDLCRKWAALGDPHTNWIVKDGLRKLRESEPEQVQRIVESIVTKRGARVVPGVG